MKTKVFLTLFVVAAAVAVLSSVAYFKRIVRSGSMSETEPTAADSDIEGAMLAGDYKLLVDLCGPIEGAPDGPVFRAIKGHTYLAVNRNNESLNFFLSLTTAVDRETWRMWTEAFTQRHPASWVAHYFKGDALARLREWDAAVAAFDSALRMNPTNPLIRNARGVALAGAGDWVAAHEDFKRAAAVPNFADGQASLGTWWFYHGGFEGAIEAYKRALGDNRDCALALNGIGCCHFNRGPEYWLTASNEFALAGKLLPVSVFAANLGTVGQASADTCSKATLYLRASDLVDWAELRRAITDQEGILSPYFAGIGLAEVPTRPVADAFNRLLDDNRFYDQNRPKVDQSKIGSRSGLHKLLIETEKVRAKDIRELNGYERCAVRGLNRALLEVLYPRMIAEAGEAAPGMSLTLTGGLAVNAYNYKNTLPTSTILAGQANINNVWKPMANFVGSFPYIGSIGKNWTDYLNNQTSINTAILNTRGVTGSNLYPGGVSTAELMAAFYKQGDFRVLTWFGLAYDVLPDIFRKEGK